MREARYGEEFDARILYTALLTVSFAAAVRAQELTGAKADAVKKGDHENRGRESCGPSARGSEPVDLDREV